jgi:hypothetical protein
MNNNKKSRTKKTGKRKMKSRLSVKLLGIIFGMLILGSLIAVHAEDMTPPSIISVTPADNSVNVPLKTHPTITFSEPVETSTLGGSINGMPIHDIQTVFDTSNQTVTLDLGEMEYATTYTVTINGSLEDTSGNQMGSNYTFSFSTVTGASKRPTSTIILPSVLEAGKTYNITGKATGYIWQKDPANPLELIHWNESGVDVGGSNVLHPTVLYFPNGEDGYKFYLIYTPFPPGEDENPCLMRSNDGVTFDAINVTNPLLTRGTQPIYDEWNLADPDAIKVGNTWMIFYEMEQSNYGHIGVAFSTDGIHYVPYGDSYSPPRPTFPFPTDGNPIIHFSNDTWYEHDENPYDMYPRLGEMGVVFKDGLFHMWYVVLNELDSVEFRTICYANSSDPRDPWAKLGPVMPLSSDYFGHPDVVYDPERDLYVMWYLAGGQNNIATSETPEGPWTNHPNNPIFRAEGGWEGSGLYRASLVQVGTQWYLYYSANPDNFMIGLAREVPGVRKAEISTNGGFSWTQLTVNPDGSWNYPWTPMSDGLYSIQVRVTDDWLVGEPNETIVRVGSPIMQGAPILVVVNSSVGSFGNYTGEILKAEGINEFEMIELAKVNGSLLASFDTVILTSMSLSADQVNLLENYVSAGGNLIGFKPDTQLASVFGVSPTGMTTSEGYIKVDNTTEIGSGIVTDTIQFHGTADNYIPNGAAIIATLYSDPTTPTTYPAVASFTYGSGQSVLFSYDLPKSIIYLRQGNPASANKEMDGIPGLRPNDLFVNWLDARKVPIPQADEQMRVLSNAIMILSYYKKPVPRLWYFPNFAKTLLIMTGDQDASSTAKIYQEIGEIEAYGGKFTIYLTNFESPADVQNWTLRGHDVEWHLWTSSNYTAMDNDYTMFFDLFQDAYGFAPTTIRHDYLVWTGYVDPAKIQEKHGVIMDFDYYHYGPFLNPGDGFRNGWMTGSGIPMKFADENGTIYDSYQVNTNFADESQVGEQGLTGAQAAAIAATLFNKSRDGFYTAFVANFHPVTYDGEKRLFALELMGYAQSYGIPILSAKNLLDFTDAKNRASYQNITYSNGQLRFTLNLPVGGSNLPVMLPYKHDGRILSNITVNSALQPFGIETIKGIEYAWFLLNSSGNYEVNAIYGPDTIPSEIEIVNPSNGAVLPSDTNSVTITITTDEYAYCRYNDSNPFFNYLTEGTDFALGQGTLRHSFTYSGLHNGRTYHLYFKARDAAGNINPTSTQLTFSIAFLDNTAPEWKGLGQIKSSVKPGDSTLLYSEGKDDWALKYAVLSTNETGSWKNLTWLNTSWQYRKPITLTENSGSTLSNFQVKLSINYAPSKMKPDFSDLRFTTSDQITPIPYWIESYTPSIRATVWVKVPKIPASAATTIYMYYGNPSAVDASNGTATLEFFDTFSGGTLDTSKWNVNAVNQITYTVNDAFRFENATMNFIYYWVYDGTDTGSQHQAKLTLSDQFIVEFTSKINDLTAAEMGEGGVGLVAADNTIIGFAGHHDWAGYSVLPWRGVVTENVASSLGSGVTLESFAQNYTAYKEVTSTDLTNWKIAYNGSTLNFYDNDGFFAQASVTSPVSKLALVAGAYGSYPYLDYIEISNLIVRKYALVDPSSTIGAEESYTMEGSLTWWNASWPYRRSIAITENSGSTLTDYQVNLNISYVSSEMKPDFSDLRFTTSDQITPIPYWIESYTPSVSAAVWVKIPTIRALDVTTIYMYYGNPSAVDASNGTATFDFFDDFQDAIVDTNKWIVFGSVQETDGYLQVGSDTALARQNTANYPLFSSSYALRQRGFISAIDLGYVYMGFGNPDETSFAFGPHSFNSYYTYDGSSQWDDIETGLTSYAVYDIVWTASNVKYYQNDTLRATHTNSPTAAMGAYFGAYITTQYARCDWISIRKIASVEPSIAIESEEAYVAPITHYYHGSPINMGNVAETWKSSIFTWNNPSIPAGTTVAWKILYVDASGNWNSTDQMTFTVTDAVVFHYLQISTNFGTVSPINGWYPEGTSISVEAASPAAGTGEQYLWNGWTGTGEGSYTGTSNPATVVTSENITQVASWTRQYYLQVNDGGHGTTSGSGWYNSGASAIFSIDPTMVYEGVTVRYVFTQWVGDSTSLNPNTTIIMDCPKTVTATWKTQYLVSFEQTGSAKPVYVTFSANTDPTLEVPFNTWIKANSTLTFSYVTLVDDGQPTRYALVSVNQTSPITISAPMTILATYKTQYYLTVEHTPLDIILDGHQTGQGYYDANSNATITADPFVQIVAGSSRFTFDHWSGSTSGTDTEITITMDAPKTSTANYKIQYYIAVTSAHDTPTPSTWFDPGSNFTASVTSPTEIIPGDHQWICTGFSIDGAPYQSGTSYIFEIIQSSHTIEFGWEIQYLDTTSPVTTISLDGTSGENDWYVSNITVTLNAGDSGSGIAFTQYSLDGVTWINYTGPFTINSEGTINIYYNSTDKAGNAEETKILTIKIDKTPPIISGATTTLPNVYGWYNTNVTAHFEASDSVSGIDYVVPDQTLSTEGAAQSFVGMARDKAGNVAYYIITNINIDKTPPTINGAPTEPANAFGWYRTNVTIHFTASDALSGLDIVTKDQILSFEGTNESAVGFATDKAGNTVSFTVSGISIDKTPPSISGTPTNPANPFGWHKTDVTIHFSATDALSGILSVTPDQTISTEGINQTVSGSTTDLAGNEAYCTVAGVNIDKTPPLVNGVPTTSANIYGWYKTTVIVHFTATDSLSGIAFLTPDQTLSGEGANQSVTGTAIDLADNEAIYTVTSINIDKTPPSISGAPTTPANVHGWYKTDVVVHFDASDLLSGMDSLTPDIILSTEDANQSATGVATDKAGNEASYMVSGINVDKTLPTISGAPTTSANSYGWYNYDVTVHFIATDALSGIDAITPDQILTDESIDQSVLGLAVDLAGNEASYTVTGINIDKTAPVINGAPTQPPNVYGWYNTDVTVNFTASDSLSDLDTITPNQTLTGEGAGQWITGTAMDKAGNSVSITVSDINIDKTNPTTSLTIEEPKSGVDPTYVSPMTSFTLNATDYLSNIDHIEYRFGDSSAWTNYTAPFTAPGIGNYTLYYRSIDKAENLESTRSTQVCVRALEGDVNGDWKVDSSDLSILSNAYGSQPSTENWNPNCDLNSDNQTDAKDLWAMGNNYGQAIDISGIIMTKSPVLLLLLAFGLATIKTGRKKGKKGIGRRSHT